MIPQQIEALKHVKLDGLGFQGARLIRTLIVCDAQDPVDQPQNESPVLVEGPLPRGHLGTKDGMSLSRSRLLVGKDTDIFILQKGLKAFLPERFKDLLLGTIGRKDATGKPIDGLVVPIVEVDAGVGPGGQAFFDRGILFGVSSRFALGANPNINRRILQNHVTDRDKESRLLLCFDALLCGYLECQQNETGMLSHHNHNIIIKDYFLNFF
jgi:hypothetical protein